jgi:hypothetical protein
MVAEFLNHTTDVCIFLTPETNIYDRYPLPSPTIDTYIFGAIFTI